MMSPAVERFKELVRARRALLPRKERASREVFAIASLRQVLEQLSAELAAGIKHDQDEVLALQDHVAELIEEKKAQAVRPSARFSRAWAVIGARILAEATTTFNALSCGDGGNRSRDPPQCPPSVAKRKPCVHSEVYRF
jgi:hypothetical protein